MLLSFRLESNTEIKEVSGLGPSRQSPGPAPQVKVKGLRVYGLMFRPAGGGRARGDARIERRRRLPLQTHAFQPSKRTLYRLGD